MDDERTHGQQYGLIQSSWNVSRVNRYVRQLRRGELLSLARRDLENKRDESAPIRHGSGEILIDITVPCLAPSRPAPPRRRCPLTFSHVREKSHFFIVCGTMATGDEDVLVYLFFFFPFFFDQRERADTWFDSTRARVASSSTSFEISHGDRRAHARARTIRKAPVGFRWLP